MVQELALWLQKWPKRGKSRPYSRSYLRNQQAIFYLFSSLWAIFYLAYGPNWSALMSSVLLQPFPTRSTKSMALRPILWYLNQLWLLFDEPIFAPFSHEKENQNGLGLANKLFPAYLGPFLAAFGSYLGHCGSGKWAKLVSLNVLSDVPTLFQHVPLKFMVLRTILFILPYLVLLLPLFWPLLESKSQF